MKIPQHIFCQCMKPWKICVNKKNSYKIDVQNLIDLYLSNFCMFIKIMKTCRY